MKCKICNNETSKVFDAKILNKHNVDYFLCTNCGFIQTVEPFWLEESYEEAINTTDTGILERNFQLAKVTRVLFGYLFGKNEIYLDYAGGYGILVGLLREYGFNSRWADPFSENIFARGLEFKQEPIKAITCFECFEHFADPLMELEKMLSISSNIFFSTLLFDGSKIPSSNWFYYGFEHGQHLSFYSLRTLKFLADKYKLYLYSNGKNLHLFSKKRINRWLFSLLLAMGKLLYFFQFDMVTVRLFKRNKQNDN